MSLNIVDNFLSRGIRFLLHSIRVPVVLLRKICYTYFMQRLTKSKKLKRVRKHGFFARMKTHDGRNVLKRRRDEHRKELTVSV
jgi:large subunit ribosomal protein L34